MDISQNPRGVKAKIGYMPDFFGVYDDLKVSEYMNFYSGVYGIKPEEREGISSQLLELVDLTNKKDSYVDALSRGMKQRLCLARSLIHDPKLLILDEPASGLDPRARVEMKEILKALKGMGKTILISSHILPELSELCTSIGIIDEGKIVVSGTVQEVMRKASGNRTVRIKVLGDAVLAVKFLREEPQISGITQSEDYIDASFSGEDDLLAHILKNLIENAIPVISFTEMQGSLESIFMNLTGGNGNGTKSDN